MRQHFVSSEGRAHGLLILKKHWDITGVLIAEDRGNPLVLAPLEFVTLVVHASAGTGRQTCARCMNVSCDCHIRCSFFDGYTSALVCPTWCEHLKLYPQALRLATDDRRLVLVRMHSWPSDFHEALLRTRTSRDGHTQANNANNKSIWCCRLVVAGPHHRLAVR
jgi:hypothetical protein